jgi:hypothetical protein
MSAKHVLEKDVQNIASKQIFARWQTILSIFDFDIEYIKGSQNSIPDFLTREFLQEEMTDKKKEKASASKPNLSTNAKPFILVTPSQLSSQELILRNSPTQMVNRYTTLGSTISPRSSFQSALISPPPSPFDGLPPQKPFIRYPKSSPYHTKEPPHNLFLVEPDFSHIKSPDEIAKGWHFPAIHPDKSIEFYRDILLVTKSIQVRPIPS